MIKKLVLCDTSSVMMSALRTEFEDEKDVSIASKDILRCKCDAVISPANSFGDMGGGLDKYIDDYTNGAAQRHVTEMIRDLYYGELPVGSAIIVELGLRRLQYLIVAPTMRIPGNVSKSLNAYLAMRAALVATLKFNAEASSPIQSIASAGLCTGVGRMLPHESAHQMHVAYRSVVLGKWLNVLHPAQAPFADH